MKNLSPFEKEQEVRLKLLGYLKNNPKGKHISDIQKETGISRKTLEKHLSSLDYENEIYCKQFGPTRVFYPNHRFHHIDFEVIKMKNRTIWANILENEYGLFILIRETRKIKDKWTTKGSVLIPIEKSEEFTHKLELLLTSDRISKFTVERKSF